MKHKTLSFMLFLVLIGGLFWYINKNYIHPETSDLTNNANNESNTQQDLAFVERTDLASIVYLLKDGKQKKIYTDADEPEKIVKIGSIIDNNKLPIITGNQSNAESGNLELLDLKTLKKEILQKDFKKPLIFDVANGNQSIAYVLFSNVEQNYGYNLYLGRKLILNKSTSIRAIKFANDGKKLAISMTDGLNGEILLYDLEKDNFQTAKSIENTLIDYLSFTIKDEILFSSREIGANKSEIKKLDKDNNIEQILTNEGGTINFIFSNQENSRIAYLIAQYDRVTDDVTKGQIFIYNINDASKNAIGKGTQIIGWMKEV